MSANQGGAVKIVYLMPDQMIGERFRKDLGDISDLKESIAEVGLLQPIGVDIDPEVFKLAKARILAELGRSSD